jgi:hypothetical protein
MMSLSIIEHEQIPAANQADADRLGQQRIQEAFRQLPHSWPKP